MLFNRSNTQCHLSVQFNFTCFDSSSAMVLPLLTTKLFSRDTDRLPPADSNPLLFLVAPSLILSKTPAYSMSAPNTNRTQTITHASIAVSPVSYIKYAVYVNKYPKTRF